MSDKAVRQYLQHYAEAETQLLVNWSSPRQYQHTVVIPAYKEPVTFLQNLLTAPWFRQNVLVILIINQPDNQRDTRPQQRLYDAAVHSGTALWQAENLVLIAPATTMNQAVKSAAKTDRKAHADTGGKLGGQLLLVNRFHQPIPVKQGVGLARKLGADLALALITHGIIHNDWICSTDADALLPDNYFSALQDTNDKHVAACYDFEHTTVDEGDDEITAATLTYERAMRYYVAGLDYAGSPYAQFTIGSILAVRAGAYATVRGVPKRAAGEDFYLLNKLIKLGAIARLAATVKLQARLSDRVPFGTGVSTAKIRQLNQQGEPFCYYHPHIFTALKTVLQHIETLWYQPAGIDKWLQGLPPYSAQALIKLGMEEAVTKQRLQCRSKQQFDRQLMRWFDGLKTLQFVHLLRDSHSPNLPLDTAIRAAEFRS